MISAAFAQVHRDWVRYLTYKPRHGPDDTRHAGTVPDVDRARWYLDRWDGIHGMYLMLIVPDGTSTDGMVFTACT
jgi:hypothetical protein